MDDPGEQLTSRGAAPDGAEHVISIVLGTISLGLACLVLLYLR